jgi:hypothetical protein
VDVAQKEDCELTIDHKRSIIADIAKNIGNLPPVDMPVTHRFSPGLYLREIFMPAGSIVVGKIHATEHFNIVLSGECYVYTVEGVQHIKAPYTFVSKAGIQKIVANVTDVIWQTTHVTDKTDIDEIEKDVIAESYEDLNALLDQDQSSKIDEVRL